MSKEILKLQKPLYVNGQELKALSYDIDELKVDDVLIAERNRAKASGGFDASQKAVEFDTSLHFFVGMQAIIKQQPQIDINDLKRLSGVDASHLCKIGRAFFMQTATVESLDTSEEPSATTQEDTTAQNLE